MRHGKLQSWTIAWAAFFPLMVPAAQMLSVDHTGTNAGGNDVGEAFLISGDGRYAAFSSRGTNYIIGDTNGIGDIFVYDCLLRSNVWNTCYSAGTVSVNLGSRPLDLTMDGRFLLFQSRATNHLPGISFPAGESHQLYVRDLASNMTHCVSVARDGTNAADGTVFAPGAGSPRHYLSSDGRFVIFGSSGTNLVYQDDWTLRPESSM
jgi:hypothetical protein